MRIEVHSASTSKTLDHPKVCSPPKINFYQEQFPSGTKCERNFKKNSSLVSFKLGYKKQHLVVPEKNYSKDQMLWNQK